MRLTRRELRRLIESVINEEEKKDQQLFITVKYMPDGSAHDAEELREEILDSGKLKMETREMLEDSKPGHELNHNNVVALCQIGGLNVMGSHLMKSRGKYLIDKGVIISDFNPKGATVAYRQVGELSPDHRSGDSETGKSVKGFDVDKVKKAIMNGLRTIGLKDGVSVNVQFKG